MPVFWIVLGGFIVLALSMVIGVLVWAILADLLMKQGLHSGIKGPERPDLRFPLDGILGPAVSLTTLVLVVGPYLVWAIGRIKTAWQGRS